VGICLSVIHYTLMFEIFDLEISFLYVVHYLNGNLKFACQGHGVKLNGNDTRAKIAYKRVVSPTDLTSCLIHRESLR